MNTANRVIPEHNMTCGERDSPKDAILRISEHHVPHIVTGKKNHEYRKYCLDNEVERVWLYSDDKAAIQYVLSIGPPKGIGSVNMAGLGNDEFDRGEKPSNFGYKITALRKLPQALGKEALLRDYDVDMHTSGKKYATKRLVEAFPLDEMEYIERPLYN